MLGNKISFDYLLCNYSVRHHVITSDKKDLSLLKYPNDDQKEIF